jgi:hypothetical protein
LHEETHAKQKHSLDVLFIEFLQVLFWFNPLMYFMKKAIKLNHEFLADREVLDHGIKPSLYQNILLEFSSNSLQPQLANSINYSSIKKRFTVMKTKKSKKSNVLRSLLLLPLLALLLYGFSEKKFIERQSTVEISIPSVEQALIAENIVIRITKKGELIIQDSALIVLENLKSNLQKFNTKLTKEQRSNVVRAVIKPDVDAPTGVINKVEAILSDYGVAQLDIRGPVKYSKPRRQLIVQKGATKEQIAEYNALAKKYNRQLSKSKNIQIYKSDVDRLDFIHGLMTLEQKEIAEPFPNFPEPPPSPAPKEPKKPKAPKVNKGEKNNIPAPPKSPMDHGVVMAKKDPVFYYEDKKISSDKAIAILKKNKKINLRTRHKGLKKPIVELSTKPIVIKT